MDSSFVAFALIGLVGTLLLAYLWGLSSGRSEGHEAGRREGKRDGARKGFAVGYDRGKRQRNKEEEEATQKDASGIPRYGTLLLVVVATVVVLTLFRAFMKRG